MEATTPAIAVHMIPNNPKVGIATKHPISTNKMPTINPSFDCVYPGFTFIFFGAILNPPYFDLITLLSLIHSESA